MNNDWELLRRYATQRADDAFEELLVRHMNFVYSVALRKVRNPHTADEVAQAVFILLARKAGELQPQRALTAWLYETTRLTAANALKLMARKAARQRELTGMEQTDSTSKEKPELLAEMLEDGLSQLAPHERDVIFLQYYQQMSMAEIGAALKISVDAAKKRSSRGMEKLREFFTQHGVAMSSVAIAPIFVELASHAAPPALMGAVGAQTVLAAAAANTGGTAVLAGSQQLAGMTAVKAGGSISMLQAGVASIVLAMSGTLAWAVWPTTPKLQETKAEQPTSEIVIAKRVEAPQRGIAKGWPIILPNSPVGCPTPVRLMDTKRFSIVIPAMKGDHSTEPLAHPQPELAAKIHVVNADGVPEKGWPLVLSSEEKRAAEFQRSAMYGAQWHGHPSVVDTNGDGYEEIVLNGPRGSINSSGLFSFDRFGLLGSRQGSSHIASVAVVDVDRNGELDAVCTRAVCTIAMGPQIENFWPTSRNVTRSHGPGLADMRGDGELYFYFPSEDPGIFTVVNQNGHRQQSWPSTKLSNNEFRHPPALGDVDGDGILEVALLDAKGVLQLWTWDGKPYKGTTADAGRNLVAIFKDNLGTSCTPTLADLDSDGKAEIVVYDSSRSAICAWRENGTGYFQPDGIVATLHHTYAIPHVSVAKLSDDGTLDFATGTHWVRRKLGSEPEVINLLQGQPPGRNRMGCTFADVNGDGLAEILFGLTDGRIYRYDTGMPYNPKMILWGTPLANFQRTCSVRLPAFSPSEKVRNAARKGDETVLPPQPLKKDDAKKSGEAVKPPKPPKEF